MEENSINKINSVYSDATDVSFNIYNFNIMFRLIEDGQALLLGKIKMSPETAKATYKLLGENIKQYEECYGKINVYNDKSRENERKLQEKLMKLKEKQEEK